MMSDSIRSTATSVLVSRWTLTSFCAARPRTTSLTGCTSSNSSRTEATESASTNATSAPENSLTTASVDQLNAASELSASCLTTSSRGCDTDICFALIVFILCEIVVLSLVPEDDGIN